MAEKFKFIIVDDPDGTITEANMPGVYVLPIPFNHVSTGHYDSDGNYKVIKGQDIDDDYLDRTTRAGFDSPKIYRSSVLIPMPSYPHNYPKEETSYAYRGFMSIEEAIEKHPNVEFITARTRDELRKLYRSLMLERLGKPERQSQQTFHNSPAPAF